MKAFVYKKNHICLKKTFKKKKEANFDLFKKNPFENIFWERKMNFEITSFIYIYMFEVSGFTHFLERKLFFCVKDSLEKFGKT